MKNATPTAQTSLNLSNPVQRLQTSSDVFMLEDIIIDAFTERMKSDEFSEFTAHRKSMTAQ